MTDAVATLLAAYAVDVAPAADAAAMVHGKRVLTDSLAVAFGALDHPAAQAARRYAALTASPMGDTFVWGTTSRVDAPVAALVNGVLLRCHDYNDLYIGRAGGGHPSDMVPGLLAVAERAGASGAEFLTALALAYEVAVTLFDTLPVPGWDYANLTALAACCAAARLLRLDRTQAAEALSITALQHLASDEIESGALNTRGDLTMWKRFNGGDGVRHAIDACLLASVGIEGALRPFTGALGFFQKIGMTGDPLAALQQRLCKPAGYAAIGATTMKRWPVGSRAQSAIQSALAARAALAAHFGVATSAEVREKVAQIRVRTGTDVHHHLLAIRDDPFHPISRETADHSLPYIIGAAVWDGVINVASFDLARVQDPALRAFVAERVKVTLDPSLAVSHDGRDDQFISAVEIMLDDGEVIAGPAEIAVGHRLRPLTSTDLAAKLHENADPVVEPAAVDALADLVRRVDRLESVAELGAALARPSR